MELNLKLLLKESLTHNREVPSRKTTDKHAFSIVNKAIHLGLSSGLFSQSPSTLFISLQFRSSSSTFVISSLELESISTLFGPVIVLILLNPRSLAPMEGALTSTALFVGFNNLRRNRIQDGELSN
jgi:hypothetical protein